MNSAIETWEGESGKNRSGVNNWGFSLTVDEARGIVYTVFGGPNTNFWGGDRKGNDLFANSVVAIDAATGKMKWYFQVVHHDLWDFDLPAPPTLMDMTVKWQKCSDPRADRQDRLSLHPGSRHRQAGFRHRREAGAPKRGPRRTVARRRSRFRSSHRRFRA